MQFIEEYLDRREPANGRFFTIGIDGRGSSGKSSLLNYLKELYPGFTCLHGDDYWHRIKHEVLWGEFDEHRFAYEVLEPLQTGNTFTHSFYDFQKMTWQNMGTSSVKNVFCLERTFAFNLPFTWDIKIWLETPRTVCMERGVARDTHHMGKERATKAWNYWQTKEDEYIKKTRPEQQADMVLSGIEPFSSQLR